MTKKDFKETMSMLGNEMESPDFLLGLAAHIYNYTGDELVSNRLLAISENMREDKRMLIKIVENLKIIKKAMGINSKG